MKTKLVKESFNEFLENSSQVKYQGYTIVANQDEEGMYYANILELPTEPFEDVVVFDTPTEAIENMKNWIMQTSRSQKNYDYEEDDYEEDDYEEDDYEEDDYEEDDY